jgi:hypothetical protein
VRFERLHNDSTSISFCGQYRDQRPRFGRTAAAITYGYSKNVAMEDMWRPGGHAAAVEDFPQVDAT